MRVIAISPKRRRSTTAAAAAAFLTQHEGLLSQAA